MVVAAVLVGVIAVISMTLVALNCRRRRSRARARKRSRSCSHHTDSSCSSSSYAAAVVVAAGSAGRVLCWYLNLSTEYSRLLYHIIYLLSSKRHFQWKMYDSLLAYQFCSLSYHVKIGFSRPRDLDEKLCVWKSASSYCDRCRRTCRHFFLSIFLYRLDQYWPKEWEICIFQNLRFYFFLVYLQKNTKFRIYFRKKFKFKC